MKKQIPDPPKRSISPTRKIHPHFFKLKTHVKPVSRKAARDPSDTTLFVTSYQSSAEMAQRVEDFLLPKLPTAQTQTGGGHGMLNAVPRA
ncbi:MAG: hypothetical protein Q8R07_04215 [Candidatus Uhrbacteria bacterium]|nr:hypothetical protein [Candidatus Uhrbacteria bacterium]